MCLAAQLYFPFGEVILYSPRNCAERNITRPKDEYHCAAISLAEGEYNSKRHAEACLLLVRLTGFVCISACGRNQCCAVGDDGARQSTGLSEWIVQILSFAKTADARKGRPLYWSD